MNSATPLHAVATEGAPTEPSPTQSMQEHSIPEHSIQEHSSQENATQEKSLQQHVAEAMDTYFVHLDGQATSDLYELVMAQVEPPLLESVLAYTKNNQSRAAEILGLNRGTLRKKLKQYNLI